MEELTLNTTGGRLWNLVHRPVAESLAQLDDGYEFRLGGGTTLAARWRRRAATRMGNRDAATTPGGPEHQTRENPGALRAPTNRKLPREAPRARRPPRDLAANQPPPEPPANPAQPARQQQEEPESGNCQENQNGETVPTPSVLDNNGKNRIDDDDDAAKRRTIQWNRSQAPPIESSTPVNDPAAAEPATP